MFTSLVGFFLLFCAILVSAPAAPAKLVGSVGNRLWAGVPGSWTAPVGGLRASCWYGGSS